MLSLPGGRPSSEFLRGRRELFPSAVPRRPRYRASKFGRSRVAPIVSGARLMLCAKQGGVAMAAFRASTYIRSALAGGCLLVAAVGSPSALQVAAPPDPRLESFDAAVARYAALRARIQEPLPDFDDPRRDDWTRLLMRRYLASAIRTARREAEPGAIFAPA